MEKVTLDQIIGNIGAEEDAKRQEQLNAATVLTQAPLSVKKFEQILSEAVNQVNNKFPGDVDRISFKMPSKDGTGSLERGRVCYRYSYSNGKLSIAINNSRLQHTENFVAKLTQEKPVANSQDITIQWHCSNESFTSAELATALLNRFIKDY